MTQLPDLFFKTLNSLMGNLAALCPHEGTVAAKGREHTCAYPFEENSQLRNQPQTDLFIDSALESGKAGKGIKDPSILSQL